MKTKKNYTKGTTSLIATISAALLSIFLPQLVSGQEVDDRNRANRLDEIIVTATKREENIQDVPISITAIGAEQIKAAHAQSLRDLEGSIANFHFAEDSFANEASISIRGIYQHINLEAMGLDVGYGVYVDGLFVGKQMAVNSDLGEVERVEILRGPQGTLFGKNTIAGAINIVTKKPGNDFKGSVEADFGNFDHVRVRASVDVPMIADVLAARLSLSKARRDGYGRNTFNNDDIADVDEFAGRLQVAYTPSEQLRVYLNINGLDSEWSNYSDEILGAANGPYTMDNDVFPQDSRSNFSGGLTIEYDIGEHTITSITGLRESDSVTVWDLDRTALDGFWINLDSEQKLLTQELRLNSPVDNWFNYVAGIYYFEQDNDKDQDTVIGPDWFGPFDFRTLQTVDVESFAAFIHTNFQLGEHSTLFAGIRYTDENKKLTHSQVTNPALPFNLADIGFFEGVVPIPTDVDSSDPSWTVGLRQQFTDDLMVYGSISRGFKSGGFNALNLYNAGQLENGFIVKPEFVTAYEVGIKSVWLENRLRLNAALFYMDYEDLQVVSWDPNAGPNGEFVLRNAATVVSKGFELELAAYPIENLSVDVGIGYADSTFDEFPGLFLPRGVGGPLDENDGVLDGRTDASGNRVPRSPEWTFNVAIQHEQPFKNGATWLSRLEYNHVDDTFSSTGSQNTPDQRLPSYGLLNARVGYESSDDRWGVYLWGRNLTDEEELINSFYFETVVAAGVGVHGKYITPRTYGVTLNYDF